MADAILSGKNGGGAGDEFVEEAAPAAEASQG
jgi:small subunit ribosomal protein S2